MANIFEELRKAREEVSGTMNESAEGAEGTQDTGIGTEGAPAEGGEGTPAPEAKGTEGAPAEGAPAEGGEGTPAPEGEVNEEVVVLACPHCGIISGVNEAAVEECPICGEEALLEKVVKVVRDGKIVKKKVPTKKKILTPAQKAALVKARKKAHTAGANKARKKSMKIANRINDEDYYECPECGFSGDLDEFDQEDGVILCPECGAEVNTNESKKKGKCNESVDELKAILESMDAPEVMFTALENGKTEMVNRYIERMVGEE